MTRLFVPAFDALWEGEKRRLRLASRSIYLRLCLEAVIADTLRHGYLVLPRAPTDAAAMTRVTGCTPDDAEAACTDMVTGKEPLLRFANGWESRREIRFLWMLDEMNRVIADVEKNGMPNLAASRSPILAEPA